MAKKAPFWPKRPKSRKNPKNAHFGQFSLFWGFSGPLGPPREVAEGLVLHQPLAAGPCGPSRGSGVPSAVQARGPARIGWLRGSPPGSASRGPRPRVPAEREVCPLRGKSTIDSGAAIKTKEELNDSRSCQVPSANNHPACGRPPRARRAVPPLLPRSGGTSPCPLLLRRGVSRDPGGDPRRGQGPAARG